MDREWAVVLRQGDEVLNTSKYPKLGSATAAIEGNLLVVRQADMPDLIIATDPVVCGNEKQHPYAHYGIPGVAREQGQNANEWFSRLLGVDVYLARIDQVRHPRDSVKHQGISKNEDNIAFHDFSTLHIICVDGIRWLQERVSDNSPVTTRQFRANIVVDGIPFPEEDRWSTLRVGSIPMRVAKPCGRCVIPTHIDGVRNKSFEPTATLRRLRSCFYKHQLNNEKKSEFFMFGLNLFHDVNGTLTVGDEIVIKEEQAPLQFTVQQQAAE